MTSEEVLKELNDSRPVFPSMETDRKEKTAEDFYLFRSALQHRVKRSETATIMWILSENIIENYRDTGEYLKCLYCLACLDTLCERQKIPFEKKYDNIREIACDKPAVLSHDPEENVVAGYFLPYFLRHNIYEKTLWEAC